MALGRRWAAASGATESVAERTPALPTADIWIGGAGSKLDVLVARRPECGGMLPYCPQRTRNVRTSNNAAAITSRRREIPKSLRTETWVAASYVLNLATANPCSTLRTAHLRVPDDGSVLWPQAIRRPGMSLIGPTDGELASGRLGIGSADPFGVPRERPSRSAQHPIEICQEQSGDTVAEVSFLRQPESRTRRAPVLNTHRHTVLYEHSVVSYAATGATVYAFPATADSSSGYDPGDQGFRRMGSALRLPLLHKSLGRCDDWHGNSIRFVGFHSEPANPFGRCLLPRGNVPAVQSLREAAGRSSAINWRTVTLCHGARPRFLSPHPSHEAHMTPARVPRSCKGQAHAAERRPWGSGRAHPDDPRRPPKATGASCDPACPVHRGETHVHHSGQPLAAALLEWTLWLAYRKWVRPHKDLDWQQRGALLLTL